MPAIKDSSKRNINAMRIFGCDEAKAIVLNEGLPLRSRPSLAMSYVSQRHSAAVRGIDWQLTFSEWIDVWKSSGRLALRGVGVGRYCMCRRGDVGPYAAGNVFIALATENSRDGLSVAVERTPSMRDGSSRLGVGRGWTFRDGAKKPYQVVVRKKYIGIYATQEEAEAAYAKAVGGVHSSDSAV